jgi:putative ABC transport system permease protein
MFALCRALSLHEIRRHPGRSSLISASIALGVIAWTTTWALSRALDDSLREATTPTAAADLYVSNGESGLDRELVGRVASVDGVRSARPVVIERIRITGRESVSAVLLGVDVSAYRDAARTGLSISPGTSAAFLKGLLLRENPVLLGASLRKQIAPEGEALTAMIEGKKRTLQCVGTLDAVGPLSVLGGSIVLTGDREAAELAGHPGRISRIDVELGPNTDTHSVRDRIALAVANAGEVITPEAHDGRVRESLGALRTGFALCGMGALALALSLVATVLGVSVAERRRTIGLLRSLGGTSGQVRVELIGGSLILGAIGSGVGVPLGFGVARLSLGPLLHALGDVFVPLHSEGIAFAPSYAAGGVAAGLITSVLAAWIPASRAAALTPTQAMRRNGTDSTFGIRGRAIGAASLIGLAMAAFLGRGIVRDSVRIYLTLALGLVGAFVAIPLAAGALARLLRPIAEHIAGIPGRLAVDSLIRSPSRTGSAIAGLAGGVALMLQTGGVIQGNESAVRAWVDDCITGDLFITSGGPMSASGRTIPMDESIGAHIVKTLPGAKVVPMRFRHLDWSCRGEATRVLLLLLDSTAYVAMSANRVPPLKDRHLYRLLAEPGTALVSENFAALNGLRVGSTISLPGADGPVSLKIAGTVVDFSNNRGTIMVDRRGVGNAFSTSGVDLFAVGLGRGFDPEAARLAVNRSSEAAENAIEAMTREALRGHILGMIRRLYGVAYVQEVVAATVAALGVSASMLICVVQRRRELALLRALGATSRQVFVTVIAEAVVMAIIGVALGAALGLVIEWYVLRVILLVETGFSFPVLLPWTDALMISAVVGVAAVVSGIAPALSASRIRVGIALARE